jgi:tetratricopeptide (TPR) repeat protein
MASAPNPASESSPDASRLFAQALEVHRAGKIAEAEAAYRALLSATPDNPEALHYLGLAAFQAGRIAEAEAPMRRALELRPDIAFFHSNYGLLLQAQGQLEAAAASYERALQLDAGLIETELNRAKVLAVLGRNVEAAESCERVTRLKPDDPQPWRLLVNLHLALGDLDLAEACCDRIVALEPASSDAHNTLGNVRQRQGRFADAVAAYHQALDCDPIDANARAAVLGNLGSALQALERYADAVMVYGQAAALMPHFPEAFYNMGSALQHLGQHEQAAASFMQAVTLRPDHALAWNNLGNTCLALNRTADAEACYRRALALQPNYALAHYNLGCLLGSLGDPAGAIAAYEQALALKPGDPHLLFSIGLLHLAQGQFASGWGLYENRWQSPDHDTPNRPYPQPRWDGNRPPQGKVLLWGEQGIGDALMFAGLVPDALATGSQIVLDCDPRLFPLFARSFPGVELVSALDPASAAQQNIVAHLPTGSLPSLFRGSPAAFARTHSPYLFADAAERAHFRTQYADGRRIIGLAWNTRGKKTGTIRSIPLTAFAPLFGLPGIRWVSLQYGDFDALEQEIATAHAPIELDRTVDQMKNLDLFAAQIAALDLVLTIDNSTAHLAGALGIPTWLLLPHVADWRWLLQGDASPWYPTLRLFRQPTRGDWTTVLTQVEQALTQMAP